MFNRLRVVSLLIFILFIFSLSACGQVRAFVATATPTASATATATSTHTSTPTPSRTHSPTHTLTPTLTPTATNTSTPSATPTFDFMYGIGRFSHAWCNYGPASAYLFRYDITEGMHVYIHNRNADGSWLWVQPFNTNAYCWTHYTVLDIYGGEISNLYYYDAPLPITTYIGPLEWANAYRNGNEVTIEYPYYYLSEDKNRGYLLELNLCQNGAIYWTAIQTDNTTYTVMDEPGCSAASGGQVRIAEKHGYTEPITIPWPGFP